MTAKCSATLLNCVFGPFQQQRLRQKVKKQLLRHIPAPRVLQPQRTSSMGHLGGLLLLLGVQTCLCVSGKVLGSHVRVCVELTRCLSKRLFLSLFVCYRTHAPSSQQSGSGEIQFGGSGWI